MSARQGTTGSGVASAMQHTHVASTAWSHASACVNMAWQLMLVASTVPALVRLQHTQPSVAFQRAEVLPSY